MQNEMAPGAQQEDVTDEMIARRAHEIHESGQGGSPEENWWRAANELRGSQSGGSAGETALAEAG
jgi:hypothetical protein